MPVTTTARDIVNAAYAKSLKSKPGTIATDATELLDQITRHLRSYYLEAAVINRDYFGTYAIGTLDANGAINIGLTGDPNAADPVRSMNVIDRIEVENKGSSQLTNGQEINLITLTDPDAAEAPRATIRGNMFRQYKTELAGVTSIRVYYSPIPFKIATLDTTLDANWREEFNELPILDLAIYLAIKDNRTEELGGLEAERKMWYGRFLAQIQGYTSAVEKGRFGRTAGATKQ